MSVPNQCGTIWTFLDSRHSRSVPSLRTQQANNRQRLTSSVPHCAEPLGTVTVQCAEPLSNTYWRHSLAGESFTYVRHRQSCSVRPVSSKQSLLACM
jgi:hypothetical protein